MATVATPGVSRSATGRDMVKRARAHATAVARGAVLDGPRHSFHAIARRPFRYTGMLVSIAALGAGAKAAGIDPEPVAIALSSVATLWSAWRAIPALRSTAGLERSRLFGREVLWPMGLSAGTTIAGHFTPTDSAHAGHALSAKSLAKTGLQSGIIGLDVPTIAQTILDGDEK